MKTLLWRPRLVAVLALALAACAPAAPSPTAPPPKPAEPPKPTVAPAKPAEPPKPTAEPAKPTQAPAAKPTEKPAAKALPADYFAGKTVTLLVNFSAGGPTDIFARMLPPHLERYLPGKPTIIVQNMPGAGGVVGLNHLYNVAKKDGLTIGVITSPFSEQVMGGQGVQYDASKFIWLGGVDETSVGFVHKDLGIKTPQELPRVDGKLIVGGLSPDSTKDLGERTFFNLLGLKYRYVTGFPGNADARAAFVRGELNFFEESLPGWITGIVPLVREGTAFPIAQRGLVKGGQLARDPRVKDIPTYHEVAVELKGEATKKTVEYRAMALVTYLSSLLRGILLPPGTDAAVTEGLRKAVADVFADKEFQAAAEKQLQYRFEFTPGVEAQALAEQIIKQSREDTEALQYLKKLAQEKG